MRHCTGFSAGGVLLDQASSRVVCIRPTRSRRPVIGLPKGHPNPVETSQQAAIREVQEETGFIVRISDPAVSTTIEYSFFHQKEKVVKTVQYFLMHFVQCSSADHDHEVAEVLFLEPKQAMRRLPFDKAPIWYRRSDQAFDAMVYKDLSK